MKAQAFLGRAYKLDTKINVKLEQLEHYRSLAYKVTGTLKQDKISSGTQKSSLEDAIIKIVMEEEELNAAIDRFVNVKREISGVIELLGNDDEQILLELRYLCFNTWEQIAVKMNYGMSNVFRVHRNAIGNIEGILEMKRRCESA